MPRRRYSSGSGNFSMILVFAGAVIYILGGPDYQQFAIMLMLFAILFMALDIGGRR